MSPEPSVKPLGRVAGKAAAGGSSAVVTKAQTVSTARQPSASLKLPISDETWAKVVAHLSLSPQHARLVVLLLQGKRNKEIAQAMGIAEPTLKTYMNRVFRRVQVRDRLQLVVRVCGVALTLSTKCRPSG